MYTTCDNVRRKLGLTDSEASDEVILDYITEAQKDMLKDTSLRVLDEKLSGDIDGSNNTFTTSHPFIADNNFDLSVNTLDVSVYQWGTLDDPTTKESVSPSILYGNYGVIVLSSAPSGTIASVTASYSYYENEVDLTLIPDACAFLAAYYYALGEMVLVPESWTHGAYRFRIVKPYLPLYEEYLRGLGRILHKDHAVGLHDEQELLRR